jgi:hypothetical protein
MRGRFWWLRDVQAWALEIERGPLQVCSHIEILGHCCVSTLYDPAGFQTLRGVPNAIVIFAITEGEGDLVVKPFEVRA